MMKFSTAADRRVGASRLSTWSGRRIAALWLIWPGILLVIGVVAVLLSIRVNAGLGEARADLTRAHLIWLGVTAIIPPACLTVLWWRMRGRRANVRAVEENS